MTDEELLTLAAKAAGYTLWWKEGICKGGPYRAPFIGDKPWRPLEDDGDAFRLAVKLEMRVSVFNGVVEVDAGYNYGGSCCYDVHDEVDTQEDPYAATRRAIVRAAAELGEDKP